MPRHALTVLLVLAALMQPCKPAFAAPDEVSLEQQAVFFLRTLIYERNMEPRAQDRVKLAIVHQAESLAVEELIRIFSAASTHGIKGKPVEIVALRFSNIGDLHKSTATLSIDAVYIDQSANEALSSILQVTRALQTPSFASSISMVRKGAALGIHMVEKSPRLAINLRAAQLENIVLPARVLRISTLIK